MKYEEISNPGIEAVQVPFELDVAGVGIVPENGWIVRRGDKIEAYTDAGFRAKFRPAGSGGTHPRSSFMPQEFGGMIRTRNS